jgi:hypothetical protein
VPLGDDDADDEAAGLGGDADGARGASGYA